MLYICLFRSGGKMRKSSVVIIIFVSLFAIFLGFKYFGEETKTIINQDALNFKKEYERLNNKINKNNNKLYPEVNISEKNIVKYSSYDEIIQIIKQGTGVIYLGYPECPWCRNLVPILLSAANETEMDHIYYLNIKEDRDVLILDESKNIIIQNEGKKEYFELVGVLNEILDDYILTTNDGEEVTTGKKRIYVPLVLFVKDGKITNFHLGTVDSQEDPYVHLTDKQEEELLLKFINYMSVVNGSLCDDAC